METLNVNKEAGRIGGVVGAVREQDVQLKSLGGVAMAGEACRENAKTAIRSRVSRLRREADRLELLAQSLPEVMSPAADEALWDLVTTARR